MARSVGGWRKGLLRKALPRRTAWVTSYELRLVMEQAVRGWLESEDQYDAVIKEYRDKYQVDSIVDEREREGQKGVADADANNDMRLRLAISNGQWHRDRAQTAALALLVRRMVRRGGPSTKE